jgi:uncharacterized protein
MDPSVITYILSQSMPFGKYKGQKLYSLPVYYLEWLQKKGFPQGKLGMALATLYEIKTNGLDYLLKPLVPKP